jgi:hypothetical protein
MPRDNERMVTAITKQKHAAPASSFHFSRATVKIAIAQARLQSVVTGPRRR